jgi:hypothetical protein
MTTDRYSKRALARQIVELQQHATKMEGVVNALVAMAPKGEVFIAEEAYHDAARGRVSIKYSGELRGLQLRYDGEPIKTPGMFARALDALRGRKEP